MLCKDCNRFSTCEIMSEMQKLRYEIMRARRNVQSSLFQNAEELKEENRKENMRLRNRRLELRRKQCSCLMRRNLLHHKGYSCFKRKLPKEDRDTINNGQGQTLESYF